MTRRLDWIELRGRKWDIFDKFSFEEKDRNCEKSNGVSRDPQLFTFTSIPPYTVTCHKQ